MTTTDKQAFSLVLARLRADVGRLLDYVIKNEQEIWPFWAFLRMLMPIAESIGDLVYQKPGENLYRIFKEDLVKKNENYGKAAALIILLYRHSLVHQDELRVLKFSDWEVAWALTFDWNAQNHLKLQMQDKRLNIVINIKQLYEDIVWVCKKKYHAAGNVHGDAGKRYDEWRTLTLVSGANKVVDAAIKEAEAIFK